MYGASHYALITAFPQDALEVIGCENLPMKRSVALTEASSSPNAHELVLVWEHFFSCDKMQKTKTIIFALVCNIFITSYSIMQLSYNSGVDP